MANSVDPDVTPRSEASHLGLHCSLSVRIHMVNTVHTEARMENLAEVTALSEQNKKCKKNTVPFSKHNIN